MEIDLGPRIGDGIYDPLSHVLDIIHDNSKFEDTMALEFGVATGTTLNMIAEEMPVVGFDSFNGLPEYWRPGFAKGMFAQSPPEVLENASLRIGLFSDSLPRFEPERDISLIHIDCDLYSSTVMVLWHLNRWIRTRALAPVCYIVFDEFHSYQPDWRDVGESLAWTEWTEMNNISYDVVGHGPEQLVVKF